MSMSKGAGARLTPIVRYWQVHVTLLPYFSNSRPCLVVLPLWDRRPPCLLLWEAWPEALGLLYVVQLTLASLCETIPPHASFFALSKWH